MGPTAKRHDATKVGPISILETLDLLPRDEARQRLGLPHGRPVALVTLGSGMLGDVAGPGRRSVSTFLDKTEEWHVAVTRSPVAINEVPFEQASRITEIRDVYPLAIYLKAFDLAVSSAGYNAVHEMLPAGIPSVLVANTSTRTDDQVARASQVEEEGLALSVADTDLDGLEAKLVSLLDSDLRSRVGSKAAATRGLLTGASEVGALSVALAGRGPSRRPGLKTIASHQVQRAKDAVKDLLGEKRTAELKKALGRGPSQTHQRARVQIVDDLSADAAEQPMHLAVVESVTSDELRAAGPVEHLLAESSGNYRHERLEIIEAFYDVLG